MDKITQLQSDFKAGTITQQEYLTKLQALLDAGDIEQAEYDGAKGYDGKDADDPAKRMVTMTQADLDALIAKEKGRAKKPYADYDANKTRLTALEAEAETRRLASLTETERLQADKDAAIARATEAEERATKTQESANNRVIDAEVRSVARAENANDVNDVLSFVNKTNIAIDDDGNVTGVVEAVKTLKEAKPYLFKAATPGADAGGGNPDRKHDPNAGDAKKLAELADTARRTGRTEDKVAYASFKREMDAKK
jgi:hypothetical protein